MSRPHFGTTMLAAISSTFHQNSYEINIKIHSKELPLSFNFDGFKLKLIRK